MNNFFHRFVRFVLFFFANTPSLQKQVAQYTKVINHVWDIANKAREEWESEAGSRTTQAQTSSTADTNVLVTAVGMGSGLKVKKNSGQKFIPLTFLVYKQKHVDSNSIAEKIKFLLDFSQILNSA